MMHEDLTGIVLAGGYSSRYGCNKALAMFGGRTMIEHSIRALDTVCSGIVISGDPHTYGHFNCKVIPDNNPHLGPVGGIASTLASIHTSKALFVTCDMPLISPEILEPLTFTNSDASVWKDNDGRIYRFPMFIDRSHGLKAAMQVLNGSSHSVRALLDLLDVKELTLKHDLRIRMSNINYPSDAYDLQKLTVDTNNKLTHPNL